MIDIVTDPISVDAVLEAVRGPEAGAIVLFLGTVRDATAGRPVERLSYEAYEGMARAEMARLVDEAGRRWTLHRCAIVHRTGVLNVGDVSIAIAASAPHRAEAFEAARFLIDALKQSVPIWKQEHFTDGDSIWVQGA